MVGDDQRQLDILLPGALADSHPARGHRGDWVWQAPRPAVVERAGRGDDDVSGHLRLGCGRGVAELAQLNAEAFVELVQPLDGAVEVDRVMVAPRAQLGD